MVNSTLYVLNNHRITQGLVKNAASWVSSLEMIMTLQVLGDPRDLPLTLQKKKSGHRKAWQGEGWLGLGRRQRRLGVEVRDGQGTCSGGRARRAFRGRSVSVGKGGL